MRGEVKMPEFGLEVPRSKWDTSPKTVAHDQGETMWDVQIQKSR